MNNACTQEFLDLKNPTIIKTVLENLTKAALIIFLQQRGFNTNSLKAMSKTKLIDEVIKTKTSHIPQPAMPSLKF